MIRLVLGLIASTCILPLATRIAEAASGQPPNIILILADDLGYGQVGCYGQQKIRTPRIDQMARDGMRFTQAYAGSQVCQPSRCVLMTGLHTGHTPVRANDVDQFLQGSDTTVAEVLQQAGYATGVFGKWGLGPEGTPGIPRRQGFDQFFGQLFQVHAHFYYPYWVWENETWFPLPGNERSGRKQYVEDEIHARAVDFIRQHQDGPFFAYVPYIIPHVELVVPEDSMRPYRGKFPRRAIPDRREGYISSKDGLTTYAGMVSRLDCHVGEILDLLQELDIADNTLVLFTSDNGPQGDGMEDGWARMTDFFAGADRLRGYKGTFYEGGVRVPLIVRWPDRVAPDSKSDHIVGFWDLLPTFAEVAKEPIPKDIDGISFLPTLAGNTNEQSEHDAIYWEYPLRNGVMKRAARQSQWKVVQPRLDAPAELYNLAEDPGERHNVAADHPEVVQELTRWMDDAHRPMRPKTTNITRPTIKDFVR